VRERRSKGFLSDREIKRERRRVIEKDRRKKKGALLI